MSAILKEESQRFGKLFVYYTKIIVGGMLFATLFFFIFAGVKANYISLEILSAVLATFSIGFTIIFSYLSIRAFGSKNEFESVKIALKIMDLELLKAQPVELSEKQIQMSEKQIEIVRKQISQEVMNLSPSQLETLEKQRYSSRLFAYSTSRLIGFIIAGALRNFLNPEAGGFMPKPQEDEVEKRIAH